MLNNQEADKHEECCKAMGYKFGESGETIVKEGSLGETFYILLKGSVAIYKSEPVETSMMSFSNFNEENEKFVKKNSFLLKNEENVKFAKKNSFLMKNEENTKFAKKNSFLLKTPLRRKNSQNENFGGLNEEKLNKIKVLKAGEAFGELSLIDGKPRAASVICEGECHLAILEKQFFDRILSNSCVFHVFVDF